MHYLKRKWCKVRQNAVWGALFMIIWRGVSIIWYRIISKYHAITHVCYKNIGSYVVSHIFAAMYLCIWWKWHNDILLQWCSSTTRRKRRKSKEEKIKQRKESRGGEMWLYGYVLQSPAVGLSKVTYFLVENILWRYMYYVWEALGRKS